MGCAASYQNHQQQPGQVTDEGSDPEQNFQTFVSESNPHFDDHVGMQSTATREQEGVRAEILRLRKFNARSAENLPAFGAESARDIVIDQAWMKYSGLGLSLRRIKSLLAETESQRKLQTFKEAALECICKAYRITSHTQAQQATDPLTGGNVLHNLQSIQNCGEGGKRVLAHALWEIAHFDSPDSIFAKLTEVCDRAPRCPSAKKLAFNLLILHAGKVTAAAAVASRGQSSQRTQTTAKLTSADTHESSLEENVKEQKEEIEEALSELYAMFGRYLDDHKERAWRSAFEEPARCYFDLIHDQTGLDHVNVHGLNWYLVFLDEALQCSLHIEPERNDQWAYGLVDHWRGLTDAVWEEHFSSPANFGKEYTAIAPLRQGKIRREAFVRDTGLGHRGSEQRFPHGAPRVPPHGLKGLIHSKRGHGSSFQKAFRTYADRFCHFFREPNFVRRCFETLNAENLPEFVGFRRAAEVLYKVYAASHGLSEESFIEYVYAGDDYFTELDVSRTRMFLGWIGLLRLSNSNRAELIRLKAAADAERSLQEDQKVAEEQQKMVCLICMEEKGTDVTPIEHAENTMGDVSEHRMCSDCRRAWGKNICPFCKEATTAAELVGFIKDLVRGAETSRGDPNASAALMETVQLFEMEHNDQPQVIKRVYRTIVEDPGFGNLLDTALKAYPAGAPPSSAVNFWPRDMAGILWRLEAAARAGELTNLEAKSKERLCEVSSRIWGFFEAKESPDLDPHFYGALYTQAIVPWLCALKSGMASNLLAENIRRAGHALVHWKQTTGSKRRDFHRIRERMHKEYVGLTHVPIWGSKEDDPVWRTFY